MRQITRNRIEVCHFLSKHRSQWKTPVQGQRGNFSFASATLLLKDRNKKVKSGGPPGLVGALLEFWLVFNLRQYRLRVVAYQRLFELDALLRKCFQRTIQPFEILANALIQIDKAIRFR